MKTKFFIAGFLLVTAGYYWAGCNDTIDSIGINMKPEEDKIAVFDTTLNIDGRTIRVDSLYAKSINGLLGQFQDPVFGGLKADYVCEYYPALGFSLDSIIGESGQEIDSVLLQIIYTSYVGDSLAPMEVSVYPVNVPLQKDYYTDIDPSQFCDMNRLWGRKAYTARNLNISDSLNLVSSYKMVSVPLSREWGQSCLDEYRKPNHGQFTPADFTRFFPGTYIASTFGSGCILQVENTEIDIYYTRLYTTQGSSGQDSIYQSPSMAVLNVTKEVVQLNNYKGLNDDHLLEQNDSMMYLKSPAGIFCEILIPLNEVKQTLGSRKFNNVRLSIEAYPKEDRDYVLNFPGLGTSNTVTQTRPKLLLIEPDSVKSFFEERKYADGQTSFYTTFDASAYAYTFDNISNVIQNAIDKGVQKDYLSLYLIPVDVSYYLYYDSYSYSSYPVDNGTAHYLLPSAVTLKKGGNQLEIQIIATDLEKK
ncbi:MAG: DUF4270 domain-containing protein [Candidatus Azobacteroides sp.]|nr:DUF4270 domain-containing protein [Candidatus Azobacteroides sp.]